MYLLLTLNIYFPKWISQTYSALQGRVAQNCISCKNQLFDLLQMTGFYMKGNTGLK